VKPVGKLEFQVSEKRAVSIYGLGRFSATLYGEQDKRKGKVNTWSE